MFIEGFVVKNAEYVFTPGVIVEDLGSDSAVLVLQASEVLTLSGETATVIRRIRAGEAVDGAEAVVSDLVARGVIQPAGDISRRGVVRAGVIGAGAGIAALAMPSLAAASSSVGGGGFGRNDWFTSSLSASGGDPALFQIAYRLGAPPWGSGVLTPNPHMVADPLPADFTRPSGLTVPGVGTLPFHSFLNQFGGGGAVHTNARWETGLGVPADGQIVSFEVNGVTYEVEVSLSS